MAQTTEYRLETLETVLAEFIMQTNRSLTRMERDTEDFKEQVRLDHEAQQRRDEQRLTEAKAYREEQQRKEEQRLAEAKAYQEEQQQKEEQRLTEAKAYREEQQRKEEQRLTEAKAYREEQKQKEEEYRAAKKRADDDWVAEKKLMNREWNQKWGEMTEKLGTFAEDLAAPNLKRIARDQFGCKGIDYYAVRIDKKNPLDPAQMFEFDAILVSDKTIFLLEAKFTVRMKYLESLPRLIENFKLCFPEYDSYTLNPVFASMNIQPDQVSYLTRQGIYAMALGEETMELLNFDALHTR